MGIDVAYPGAAEVVSRCKFQQVAPIVHFGLRERIEEGDHGWPVPRIAQSEFACHEGMLKDLLPRHQPRQGVKRFAEVVRPDRCIHENHPNGRSLGAGLKSGIVPPRAMSPFAASRRMKQVSAAFSSSARSVMPLISLA